MGKYGQACDVFVFLPDRASCSHNKTKFSSQVTSSLADDILLLLVKSNLETEFNYSARVEKSNLPKNLSTPHILEYWLSSISVLAGKKLYLLFRVQDKDFDFSGAENIEIIEMESNVSFTSKREGHGYYSCIINTNKGATIGWHNVKITLVDDKKNTHEHLIKFKIT